MHQALSELAVVHGADARNAAKQSGKNWVGRAVHNCVGHGTMQRILEVLRPDSGDWAVSSAKPRSQAWFATDNVVNRAHARGAEWLAAILTESAGG